MNRACCWSGVVQNRLESEKRLHLLLGPEVLKDSLYVHQAATAKLPRADPVSVPSGSGYSDRFKKPAILDQHSGRGLMPVCSMLSIRRVLKALTLLYTLE